MEKSSNLPWILSIIGHEYLELEAFIIPFPKKPNKHTKGTRDFNAYLDYSYHLHGCEFEYLFSHPYS